MKFDNILVVCVGNICRSPTAEAMLKARYPDKTVHSAGVGALVGKPVDSKAAALLEKASLPYQDHKARQLTAELAQQADLILVMEPGHIGAVTEIAPFARGKTFLLGKWVQDTAIPDPYRQSEEAFVHVFELMQQACRGWEKVLGK
ncbi:low molecular weight phosphotyrosine protein phosphatase [Ferrimonas balearica]|uniref:low molecular weight protein-tyrosine-phosphatase n=1 Tax=Ferrimonas balearica TaxID=44012 RepID=UPI001C592545|nr:low molecular weight protein-tyrosine-phosphatase [Ferrimonas balearica]MBW3138230.1 low molecular weight phosphotyrosine protein phosphatase [Ferrimonas balearica]